MQYFFRFTAWLKDLPHWEQRCGFSGVSGSPGAARPPVRGAVRLQRRRVGVTFPAGVRPLARVAALVDDQVLQQPAALTAVRAAVRSLPRVRHRVLLQVAPATEGLGAHVALEGFLPGVREAVRRQRRVDPEALGAERAPVRLLPVWSCSCCFSFAGCLKAAPQRPQA